MSRETAEEAATNTSTYSSATTAAPEYVSSGSSSSRIGVHNAMHEDADIRAREAPRRSVNPSSPVDLPAMFRGQSVSSKAETEKYGTSDDTEAGGTVRYSTQNLCAYFVEPAQNAVISHNVYSYSYHI